MSSWHATGQSGDIGDSIEDIVEALLNNATNWTESTPARASIKFGNGTWDGYGSFQIHVTRGSYSRTSNAMAWHKYKYAHDLEIHVYARRMSVNKPAEWGNMERQIEKIISQNKTGAGQGVQLISLSNFEVPSNDDNLKTRWHSVMSCMALYHKVNY